MSKRIFGAKMQYGLGKTRFTGIAKFALTKQSH
jgi:hypothetical protein